MIIGVPKEIVKGENRVSVTPDTAKKLIDLGFDVIVEKDAGFCASFSDEKYIAAGAKIIENVTDLFSQADIVLKVQKPVFNHKLNKDEIDLIKKGTMLITFLFPLNFPELAKDCASRGIDVISMDSIPRITIAQKMDALSSQSNLAGYKSVLMCANELGKIFPLMMTAAGTITPAKVLIMGAGVAGLQALGTAKRLGAVVEVSDIRPAAKEEVQSLGGRFLEVESDESMQDEGGYAKEVSEEFLEKQKALLFKHITDADIVITTALVPGKKAPVLVTEEMVKKMKPGSVILDMAVEFGGNCEPSEPGKTIIKHNVKIIGETNIPSLVPVNASEMYSKNLLGLIQHFSEDGKLKIDEDDEILKSALISYKGEVVQEKVLEIIKNQN